jgi:hypothetical protein
MKYTSIVMALILGMSLLAFLTPSASAHERETFVSWEVAHQFIRFTDQNGAASPPVFQLGTVTGQGPFVPAATPPFVGDYTVNPANGTVAYNSIKLNTGDVVLETWKFQFLGGDTRRGDLFWITRLGLDFGTLGRYITVAPPQGTGVRQFIGANSFALVPGESYTAELVIRALRPTLRHLHVGVSIKDVGNVPAAPIDPNNPSQVPILYGIWTSATGPVVEPLQGVNVPGWGTLTLIATWPWATAGAAGQFALGGGFLLVMYLYGKRQARKAAGGGA